MGKGGEIGRTYGDGEVILTRGQTPEVMYCVTRGTVEVIGSAEAGIGRKLVLGPGQTFGEVPFFTGKPSLVTVKAKGEADVLTLDKKLFMERLLEDPSLAYHLLTEFAQRIRGLTEALQDLAVRSEN